MKTVDKLKLCDGNISGTAKGIFRLCHSMQERDVMDNEISHMELEVKHMFVDSK